jgi:pyrroloquinoline-quinone synthase
MIPLKVDVDARQSGDGAGRLLDVPLRHPVRSEDQAVTKIMSPEELEQELRAIGAERYHDKHPFHKLLHGGKLNKGQVQAWALNRYCYQSAVPRKDAALISRCHDREIRRDWVHRILDHDGYGEEEGGIERWLVLTDGLGLDRDYVVSMKGALPATKFAVEAYVNFVREKTQVEAVASSLTELFAPKIHKERITGMLENYDFISDDVMQYFKRRLTQAPRDADQLAHGQRLLAKEAERALQAAARTGQSQCSQSRSELEHSALWSGDMPSPSIALRSESASFKRVKFVGTIHPS